MGSADGYIKVDVGTLEISNKAAGIASADVLLKAFDILNPLSQTDDNTVIECAVVNFPIKAGKMTAETGIGVSTRKLNILGGGTIDLKTEKIDIGVNPKPREGIGLNLASLAEFVRLGGTLAEPAPATDAKGAATAGLKVGAALATGGLSVVAEGLWDRAGGDVDVCAVARGDVELPETQSATAAQPSKFEEASDAAGQALKVRAARSRVYSKGCSAISPQIPAALVGRERRDYSLTPLRPFSLQNILRAHRDRVALEPRPATDPADISAPAHGEHRPGRPTID